MNYKSDVEAAEAMKVAYEKIRSEIGQVIVGQDEVIKRLLTAIFCQGHCLLVGVPGLAKTLLIQTIASSLDLKFNRIQFTPDLMPSDVTGSSILNLKTNDFEFKKGPIFSNIVLIDEINRAPAKTQAALFECMAEQQITVDGHTYPLSSPFVVLATQNPIDHEGTYRLPEAQLDRFLFKIQVGYPTLDNEIEILKEHQLRKIIDKTSLVNPIIDASEILSYQNLVKSVFIHEDIIAYIGKLIVKTRDHISIYLGASPRASIAILEASKAFAAIQGRDFVTPEDIKFVSYPILEHRIQLTPEKEMEGFTASSVINQIIDSIEVPR